MPSSPAQQDSSSSGHALKRSDPEWEARYDGLEDELDASTFDQLLELDEEDDEEREFSASVVEGFFDQAFETFQELQEVIGKEEYARIGELGHFIKGSAATVGLTQIKTHCEQIERLGKLGSAADCSAAQKQQYMTTIKAEVEQAKRNCEVLRPLIRRRFYRISGKD